MRKRRNLVILGYPAVGKTALCVRYCTDKFSERYEPTFQNTFRKTLRQRGEEVELVITDTQGQDEQELFRKEYCLGAHGYVFVYSVSSTKSLETCIALNNKLTELMGTPNTPKLLVANKIDQERDRVISTAEGQAVAEKLGCKFVECSAKQNLYTDKVFTTILKEIERQSEEEQIEKSSCACWRFRACASDQESGQKLKFLLNALITCTLVRLNLIRSCRVFFFLTIL
jgi:small GTP-binding protein